MNLQTFVLLGLDVTDPQTADDFRDNALRTHPGNRLLARAVGINYCVLSIVYPSVRSVMIFRKLFEKVRNCLFRQNGTSGQRSAATKSWFRDNALAVTVWGGHRSPLGLIRYKICNKTRSTLLRWAK